MSQHDEQGDLAYAAALKKLQYRDCFESEIVTALEAKGFESAQIEAALSRLRLEKLVGDVALALRLAEQSRGKRTVGLELLLAKLKSRGASSEALDAVSSTYSASPLDALARFDALDPKSRARAARFLASRGFEPEEIETALEEFFAGVGAESVNTDEGDK